MKINSSFRYRNQDTSRKINRRAAFVLLIGLLLANFGTALAQNNAQPGVLYAVTAERGSSASRLLTIDPLTGASTAIGATGDFYSLAINPGGALYAMHRPFRTLYRVDAVTVQAREAAYPNVDGVQALAFDEKNTLYLATADALYTFDFKSEQTTLLSPIYLSITGLAFDPTGGTLWACTGRDPGSTTPDGIFTIDPVNGMATLVGSTGLAGTTTALAFDAAGRLFGAKDDSSNNSVLIAIDKTTGAGTAIDTTGVQAITSMAFRPPLHSGPQLGANAPTIDFGRVPVDSVGGPRTIALRNLGSEDLMITGITGASAPFALEDLPTLPAAIAPGETLTFRVSFQPPTTLAFSGTVTIQSNDAETPGRQIALRGEGFVPAPAARGGCYATTSWRSRWPGALLKIDPATGDARKIGASGLGSLAGLAVNSQGLLIATDGAWGDLLYLDASTGAATFISHTGLSQLRTIAFDENDVLYGIASFPRLIGYSFRDFLYKIDLRTGVPTQITELGSGFVWGMAFDPVDGSLWAAIRDRVYTIDPVSGVSTLVGDIGLDGNLMDLHFDAEGRLFGILNIGRDNESSLISIDKATGAATIVGATGFREINGIAFHPELPEGPQIAVNVETIDFGPTLVDSTSFLATLSIASIGSEDLTITGISVSDAAFRLSDLPALPLTLAPGAKGAFAVTFTPAAAGSVAASITISSNDAETPARQILLLGTGFAPAVADSGVLYAATGSYGTNAGSLVKIDPETGAGTLIGVSGLDAIGALAIDANGVIFGASEESGNLYLFDAATGQATLWRELEFGPLQALAFDENNILHAIYISALITVDVNSGKMAFLAETRRLFDGLAFDLDGTLWGVDDNALYSIDRTTGESRLIGRPVLRHSRSTIAGIHFDADGRLFGIDDGGSSLREDALISLEKDKAAATEIGMTGFGAITALSGRRQTLEGRKLAMRPTTVDFRRVLVNKTSLPQAITLTSIASDSVTVTGISLASGPFRASNLPALPLTLAPDASVSFEIAFTPDTPGAATDTLTVRSDDAENPVRVLVLAGEGVSPESAAFGRFYVADKENSLFTIDPGTGEATLVASIGLRPSTLAIDTSGVIYAIRNNSFDLYAIDAETGALTLVGDPSIFGMTALAFSADNVLYGATSSANLYTIDPNTAVATFIAGTGVALRGLAFDPTDDMLRGVTGRGIYTIDPGTGASTLLAEPRFEGQFVDLQFDADGNLYAIVDLFGNLQDQLATIDKATGAITIIGGTGLRSISGLAFRPQPRRGRQLALSALALDLGKVVVDSVTSPRKLILRSFGTETVTVTGITVPAGAFTLADLPALPLSLLPEETASFGVVFASDRPDSFATRLTIASDDADTDTLHVALSGTSLVLTPATPGIAYALAYDQDNRVTNLLRIDPATGMGTLIGITGPGSVRGLAANSHGILFAMARDASENIYRLDAASGAKIFTVATGISIPEDIAFDKNDALFGVGNASLYAVDIESGQTRTIAFTEYFVSLAFDPLDGRLWGATKKEIYTIDPATGASTLVGSTGQNKDIRAIDFDHQGRLFGVIGIGTLNPSEGTLIAIDKQSGTATVIGDTGFRDVRALAFVHFDTTTAVAAGDDAAIPERFALAQNYPNPFNPSTTIRYAIAERSRVQLRIFNILGQVVRTLIDKQQPPGVYKVTWDARNGAGILQASGLYIVRLRAGGHTLVRRMLLLK